MKSVFLSFSVSGDQRGRSFVRMLLARLAEQPDLRVWIYESPVGRIASGASITDACREKIDVSDLFAVLVTDQALRSDYVAMEVSHALWVRTQRELKIFPITATATPKDHWPMALREATGFRGQTTQLDVDRVDHVVWDMCLGLGIDFVPPVGSDPRLPLRHRVIHETHAHHHRGVVGVGDFQRLLDRCDKATEALAAGRSSQALRIADALLLDFQYDYDNFQPYYLQIFRASCVLAEAQAGRRSFEQAFECFDEIVDAAPAELDANAFAGRGHALMHLCRYDDALSDYRQAEKLLSRVDPALMYSQIRAQILAGQSVDTRLQMRLEQMLDEGVVGGQIGDGSRIAGVLALVHAYAGSVDAARLSWAKVAEPADVGVELVCEICHWLHSRSTTGDLASAMNVCQRLLEARISVSPQPQARDEILLHRQLARVAAEQGDRSRAQRLLALLLERYPHHAPLHAEAALLAVENRQPEEAARLCNQAIGAGRATDEVDHASHEAAVGLAYWLLGREAEARECHRRSLQSETTWFGTTLADHFGRAAR